MSFKPGDLVMVVKPTGCCDSTQSIGLMFTVKEMRHMASRCAGCGELVAANDVAVDEANGTVCFPSRLRKIDPLTEQDKTETLQEVTA